MKSGKVLWQTIFRRLKPIPRMTVSEWADTYRMVSQGNAEPGRWKTKRTPFARAVMDAFTQPGIRKVVMMASAQVCKTEIVLNVVGRFSHLDACPILLIEPTLEMAQDVSKTRLSPMIRDTKVLSKLFYDVKGKNGTSKSKDRNNTILSKLFPGGRLIMGGANSPAGLASRPIRILLCDEVDRFPPSAGAEGNPVELASKRLTTFWNNVTGLFSTPTNEGDSPIDTAYKEGTQEEWRHRCPNCKEYHTLRYVDFNTDYEETVSEEGKKTILIKKVEWVCPDCGFAFGEHTMKAAPQKYVVLNPDAVKNGIRSFYINTFSSPWVSWPLIMQEWYQAKGDPEREKVIVNTRFGETYKEVGAFADEQVFMQRREKYGAELPNGVLLLTAAVDTQDNRLEYEVCGWGLDEESWGIYKGVILGTPDKASTWHELNKVLDRVYTFENGKGLKITRVFIDSGGHYSTSVYEYCKRNFAKQRFAIKGLGGPGLPLNSRIGKAKKMGYTNLPVVELGVNDGKQQVMNRLAINAYGARYFHFPLDEEDFPNRGYDELYFKGIIAEHKVKVRQKGQIREVWEPIKGVRNEPLDLRVYNLACMQSIKPDWVALARVLGGDYVPIIQQAKPKNSSSRKVSRSANIW